MIGRTHDLAAFTALNLVVILNPIPNISLATATTSLLVCIIGGLTPDLDQPTADLWHKIPAGSFFGGILSNLLWKHRTISHSLLGLFIFGFAAKFVANWLATFMAVNTGVVWGAFMIGFVSHLVADTFTREGVPWLFPLNWYIGIPPLAFLRIKTGGNLEKYVVFPGLLLFNGYLFWNHYSFFINFFHRLF